MMIRFSVKNYKCLADVSLPLTPIHVLIGENDSGKTSLLEAMYAFFRSSEAQPAEAFPGSWDGTDLVYDGAAKPEIELGGEWDVSTGHESLTLRYGVRTVFHDETKQGLCWNKSFDAGDLVEARLQSYLADRLGAVHLYRFDAKIMSLPAAIQMDRKFRLAPDGFGLATLLDDLLGYEPQLYVDVRRQFCEYFPQFKRFHLESESAIVREYKDGAVFSSGMTTGKTIYFETQRGKRIRLQQVSEGALLFLGFLALCHLPDPPRLLLIEEPEKGIYPRRLAEVIGLLKRYVEDSRGNHVPQIVMSTHSPYVLSFFDPEEVTFLSRQPDGSVRARPLRDAPNIKDRLAGGEFYLGELWYNLSEEELFGDVQPAVNP